MRLALARWLQALALRLDPHDPFEGLISADVDRLTNSRWGVLAAFSTYDQAANACSQILTTLRHPAA
jgi:hypothetical protein